MQDDVDVTESRISGKLYLVSDYTGFSGETELQNGHYLALKFEAEEGATTTIQLIGGEVVRDPVALDSDMNCVLKITDPMRQRLKVVTSLEGYGTTEKIYRLTGLEMLDTPAPEQTD